MNTDHTPIPQFSGVTYTGESEKTGALLNLKEIRDTLTEQKEWNSIASALVESSVVSALINRYQFPMLGTVGADVPLELSIAEAKYSYIPKEDDLEYRRIGLHRFYPKQETKPTISLGFHDKDVSGTQPPSNIQKTTLNLAQEWQMSDGHIIKKDITYTVDPVLKKAIPHIEEWTMQTPKDGKGEFVTLEYTKWTHDQDTTEEFSNEPSIGLKDSEGGSICHLVQKGVNEAGIIQLVDNPVTESGRRSPPTSPEEKRAGMAYVVQMLNTLTNRRYEVQEIIPSPSPTTPAKS